MLIDQFAMVQNGGKPRAGARTVRRGAGLLLLLVADWETETEVLGKLVLRVQSVSEVDATHATVGVYLRRVNHSPRSITTAQPPTVR